MSNLCPKRMKWHFRDSRYKISRGRMPLDTLRGLAPSAIECPFQDSAPAAFQSFRRPCVQTSRSVNKKLLIKALEISFKHFSIEDHCVVPECHGKLWESAKSGKFTTTDSMCGFQQRPKLKQMRWH